MSPVRWVAAVAVTLFVVYLIGGFFIAPGQLKKQLISQASQQAGIALSIERVKVNPLLLSVTLENLASQDRQGRDLLAAGRIHVNAQLWPLLTRTIVLKELTLEQPNVNLILTPEGEPHWLDSVPESADVPPPDSDARPWVFRIDQTKVLEGLVRYAEQLHPESYATEVGGLNFSLTGLTTQAGEPAPVSMAFAHEGQGEVKLEGGFALTPLVFDGQLTVTDLQLQPSWRYARYLHGLALASGTLNGRLDIRLDGTESLDLTTSSGSWSLTNTDMTLADGSSLLTLADLTLSGPDLSLADRLLVIPQLSLRDGSVHLTRSTDGQLVLPQTQHGIADESPVATQAPTVTDESEPAFDIRIEEIVVEALPIRWTDQSVQPVVDQSLIVNKLTVRDFDLKPQTEFPVSLDASLDGGEIAWQGTHSLTPATVNGELTVARLPLPWLTGYIRESAALDLESGQMGATFALMVKDNVELNGKFDVEDFSTSSADGPLAGFSRLGIDGIALILPVSEPAQLTINTITLLEPTATFAIAQDASNNLSRLTSASPQPESEAQQEPPNQTQPKENSEQVAGGHSQPGPVVALGELSIEGGSLKFSDASVQPAFNANISSFGGSLKGLNSNVDSPAALDFSGRLEGYADIAITGELNPQDDRSKITLSSKNVDLTSANAYAGKFIGRLIERGRLDLELGYEINGNSLKGDNKITLGQLTLGSSVDSEDAVSLPLDLALALLKDPSGNIDLGLPVAGQLDDPQFRVGPIVFKAFVNLIVKAVASPFFILGKLIPGGGENLQYVSFVPGVGELGEAGNKRLGLLAKALLERPSLRLDIAGVASRGLDGPALRGLELNAALGLDGLEKGARATALREAYLRDLGALPLVTVTGEASSSDAGENSDAGESAEPPVDMAAVEQQLLDSIEISENVLRQLANARASAIKQALATADASLTERAYVLEPRLVELSGGEEVVVELVLAAD